MRKYILLALLISAVPLICQTEISLNFFVHPKFAVAEIENLETHLTQVTADSVMSVNIFAGDIFAEPISDSLVLKYMDQLPGFLYSPEDFLYFHKLKYPRFGLLATNIESDSVTTLKKFVLTNDSLKVGIFSIYTPDFAVKNQLSKGTYLEADVYELVESQLKLFEAAGCDHIILLTSLSKFVVNHLVKEFSIDSVISFDYINYKDDKLSGKTPSDFYSIDSSKGKFGRLKISKMSKQTTGQWQEKYWQDEKSSR